MSARAAVGGASGSIGRVCADLLADHVAELILIGRRRVPSALVYNATGGDVDTVIVDGRVLMRRKQITCLDEKALLAECRSAARRLLQRAGVSLS